MVVGSSSLNGVIYHKTYIFQIFLFNVCNEKYIIKKKLRSDEVHL